MKNNIIDIIKNKEKYKIIVFIIVIITAIITTIIINKINLNKTTLTQLSAQGSRQMMGYIIKTDNGKTIVIDGGTKEDTQNLIKNIKEKGGNIDYWFLTHAHDDHVGAFTMIAGKEAINIKNIYVSLNDYSWYEENEPSRAEFTKEFIDILNQNEIKDKVINPNINDKIQVDNIEIEVLGISNPEITENSGNEQSMVLKINTGKNTLLILGDTGEQSSTKLIDTQKSKLKSDIVQMSHHGQAGATKELYEIVNPKICMWPCPEWLWNNDIGEGIGTGPWKTLETRNWMQNLSVKKNYVSKDGDITINI